MIIDDSDNFIVIFTPSRGRVPPVSVVTISLAAGPIRFVEAVSLIHTCEQLVGNAAFPPVFRHPEMRTDTPTTRQQLFARKLLKPQGMGLVSPTLPS